MNNDTSISVGLPFLKCSANPSKQPSKRGKGKGTAVTQLVLQEALERVGKDPDIDPSKADRNIYLTDIKTTEEYLQLIQERKKQQMEDTGKTLRSDTVDNISLIVKPNHETFLKLTEEEQIEFLKDSKKVLEDEFKQINPDFTIQIAVIHRDEGEPSIPHLHLNFMPLVKDEETGIEKFNAKIFTSKSKMLNIMNRNFPKDMREKGWNVLDFKDLNEMTQEEQIKEREKRIKEYGRNSLKYKLDMQKENEKLKIENEGLIQENIKKRDQACTDKKKELETELKKLENNEENEPEIEYKGLGVNKKALVKKEYADSLKKQLKNKTQQLNVLELQQQNIEPLQQENKNLKEEIKTIKDETKETVPKKQHDELNKKLNIIEDFLELLEKTIAIITKIPLIGQTFKKILAKLSFLEGFNSQATIGEIEQYETPEKNDFIKNVKEMTEDQSNPLNLNDDEKKLLATIPGETETEELEE